MRILISAVLILLLASRGEAQVQHPQEGKEGWFQVDIGTSDNLRRVQFFSRSHGWIRGDHNAYHTTDGGDSWTQFSAPNDHLYHYFLNDSTGIAIGKSPDGKQLSIIRTSDRGQTWTEPFIYSSIVQEDDWTHIGDTVWFLNRGEGIRSIDGGKTWTIQFSTSAGFPNSIAFANRDTGFVVGTRSQMAGNYASFAYTIDAGKKWYAKTSYIPIDLYGIFAVSPTKVFAVGNKERIFKTTDLGESWDTLPPLGDYHYYADITFSDSLNGCIVGGLGIIRRTTDGGATWIPQKSTVEYLKDTSAMIILQDVCMIDSLYCWTVGWKANGGSCVLRTRTGGFTSAGVEKETATIIPTQIFPEPNNGLTRLKYSLPEVQNIKLSLHSMSGHVVKQLALGFQQAGENEIVLDLNDLPSGVYQFTLSSSKFTSTGQITVVR